MNTPCFADHLEPLGRILDFSQEGVVVWSCSPIRGQDGKVHVFFTRVPPPQSDWFRLFRTSGEIWHASAERPEGPYEVHGFVLSGGHHPGTWRGHGIVNPRIHAVDGTYALFYTAYEVPWPHDEMREHIGLLLSDDLWNWRDGNAGQPVLSPAEDADAWDGKIVNNAAFVRDAPPGRYGLYYRGLRDLHLKYGLGLAVSDALEGPYERVDTGFLLDRDTLPRPDGKGYRGFEDPCVWRENGVLHLLVKDMGYFEQPGGCHLTSEDGLHWSLPDRGYYGCKHYWDETGKLDSPQVLFEDGRPAYLFTNRLSGERGTGFVFRIRRS